HGVLTAYVVALALGLAILVVQLAAGHDADAPHGADHPIDHDAAPWMIVGSLRFWSFALLAFGLVGTMLHAFGLAGAGGAPVLALASGIASGVVAVTVIRRLLTRGPSSNVSRSEVVGRLARVIVPLDAAAPGKVRVELRGTWVDLVARSREPIAAGEAVLVEDEAGGAGGAPGGPEGSGPPRGPRPPARRVVGSRLSRPG